jgi:hypothetical protein
MKDETMSDLVKLHVLLSSEQMANLERLREREGKRSRKDAVRALLQIGLRVAADKEATEAFINRSAME